MVIGQNQLVLIGCDADQHRSKRPLLSQITDRTALSGTQLRDLLSKVSARTVEVDVLPRHDRISRDDLDRLAELIAESRHQVGMALDHRLHCLVQAVRIEPTV